MDKQSVFEKGWEEYKAKYKKETEELEKDISKDLQGVLRTEIKSLARFLHKLGYRKIPKNAVVLTREEYDGKEIVVEMSGGHKLRLSVSKFGEMSKILEEQTRKETAEKFAERLKEVNIRLELTRHKYLQADIKETAEGIYKAFMQKVDEICKEITEGKV